MGLPVKPLPTDRIEINGQLVTFRSLSRAEARQLAPIKDDAALAEPQLLAWAFDVTLAEAEAWIESTPTPDANRVFNAVLVFSGLTTQAAVDREEAVMRGEELQGEAPTTDPKPSTSEGSSTD